MAPHASAFSREKAASQPRLAPLIAALLCCAVLVHGGAFPLARADEPTAGETATMPVRLPPCEPTGTTEQKQNPQATPGPAQAQGSATEKSSVPSGPTTFPQALRQYFKRLHARRNGDEPDGENGANNSAAESQPAGADKPERTPAVDGRKAAGAEGGGATISGNGQPASPGAAARTVSVPNEMGAERGGRSITIEGQPSNAAAPATAGPENELGAERGGRSITIEGQPGATGTGIDSSWFSAHAQVTVVDSVHNRFTSPYSGPNSLQRDEPHAVSETSTFYFATRLWQGGDFVFNPEIAGGQGFSGATGIAGFPNGEITRVGVVEPTPYFARMFMRQTIGFGGEQEVVEGGINDVAEYRDANRLTVAAGRFSMTDVFDDNKFSHDPRTQFLAWSLMYNGAWDYPADVRGYTDGIAATFVTKEWELHYAISAVSSVANGASLDSKFLIHNGQALEWTRHYKLAERVGNFRVLGYLNRANMGSYGEALAQMPVEPVVTQTRATRSKYGFGISWDQELTKDIGVFSRVGWNDGHNETWMFTPIDRLAEIGVLFDGNLWCRDNDQFGTAFNVNGISSVHRRYLAAGGLDYNLGDGKLNYGSEMILENFYSLGVTKNIFFTLDFQEDWNPAYNRDRGPVTIFQGRFHAEL